MKRQRLLKLLDEVSDEPWFQQQVRLTNRIELIEMRLADLEERSDQASSKPARQRRSVGA
jgi:hypothetical protein